MPGESDRMLVAASELLAAGGILTIGIGLANWILLGTVSTEVAGASNLESGYVLTVVVGAVLVVCAAAVWAVPHPTGLGVGSVILSTLPFYAGLDYAPAIILGVAGGLLAIFHDRLADLPQEGAPLGSPSELPRAP